MSLLVRARTHAGGHAVAYTTVRWRAYCVLAHLAGFFYETVAPLLCIGNTSFIAISTLTSEMNFYTVRVCAWLGLRCMPLCTGTTHLFFTAAEAHLEDGPADQPAGVQVHPNFAGLPGVH